MEQRAKFRELRLAGTPREEAQTQAYGNVAPPAISWQTVQPTGGATIPIAPQVTPATPTPAPMPTGGTATPNGSTLNADGTITAPNADLTQPKPVVNQELWKVWMTDQEIINAGWRINNGIQEMPAKEVDKNAEIRAKNDAQMALNRQNAELKNQERQAIAKEAAQAMMPKSSSEMYNLITAKAPIPDEVKTTSAYRVAQNRYQRASKYLTMTPTQVANEIKTAKLIEWSEAWNDLSSMNPKLVQDATDLRNVNGNKTNIWTYSNNPDGTPVKQNNLENQFASDYLDDYGTFLKSIYTPQTQEEVTNAIYTQDVKDAQEKATWYEVELNAIEKDMDAIEKDVEKELSWSGATGSRARLEKIARKEALQSEYNSVLKSYTTYANKANNLITQNTSAYEKAYNQKQELVKAQASAAGLKYKNELALSQNQEEFDQKVAQQAETMWTPELAIPSVIEQYAGLGIMAQKSAQQHIADAKAFIAGGGTLGEYISQMQKDFQAKPEYKAKFGKTEAPTTKEIDVNGEKVTVQWNGKEWTPVQWATIERELAKQKYGSTPAVRNFNPWNIMDTWFGGKKVEWERFTVFDTPSEGFNALVAKIQNIQAWNSKVYSPDMTLLQYISKYAPSSDNNNPQGYATAIANNLGISINTKIGQIDPVKLAEEHARHEDGNSYKMLKDLWIIGGGTQAGYSDTQKNIMSGMDAKNLSTVDQKILTQNGLQADDVYNYKASLKQGKWSQWLDDTEYKRVNTVIDDLAQDQVTKTFKKSQEAYNFATKVAVWDNATDNQALIYAFAKAMDPDSVVREGEYATVQKYSQTWGQKFGMDVNRILNWQEFISEEAKKNIVNTIKSKYWASKDSYESLRNTKIKMINDIAGKDIWEKAIPSDVMELTATAKPIITFDQEALKARIKARFSPK